MREYYEQRSTAGLIITEGTWVSEDGKGWIGAPGIYNNAQGIAWRKITEAVHANGGRIFSQLWHQGAVSHPSFFTDGRLPLAPSAIDPKQMVYIDGATAMTGTPREMTHADIGQAVSDFRNAARIAMDTGFDGIQLQAGFVYLMQQFMHELTNLRTDAYGGSIENRARFLFEVLDAVLEVWPSNRVGVKTGPMMNERGLFTAVDSTLPTFEYVYDKLNAYHLSHVFLMRQMADLSKTPIAALAGDAVIHHFRKIYHGQMILNVGITPEHANDLISAGLGDFVAFGREYIANPDLVERIRLHAPLNEQRPEGYYGETAFGYTDYPFLSHKEVPGRLGAMDDGAFLMKFEQSSRR